MNDMTLRSAFRLKMKELEAYEQANTYLNYQSALKSLEDFGGVGRSSRYCIRYQARN